MDPAATGEQIPASEIVDRCPILGRIASEAPSRSRIEDIVARHGATREFGTGAVILRQGEYGSQVHLLMSGSLLVILDEPAKVAKLVSGKPRPERAGGRPPWPWLFGRARQADHELWRTHVGPRLPVADILASCETVRLAGEVLIGEVAALTRVPYGQTVVAETDASVLTLRWQGLRDLMGAAPGFRDRLWRLCHRNAVSPTLRKLPFHDRLPASAIEEIKAVSTLEVAGAPSAKTDVVRAGEMIESLLVVQSGFGIVWREVFGSRRNVGFIGRGDCHGLGTIADAKRKNRPAVSDANLEIEGEMFVLKIPAPTVERHILPVLTPGELPETAGAAAPGAKDRHFPGHADATGQESVLINFLVGNMLTNGRQAMLIDNERCVGCDECVRACARTHGGSPRFARVGASIGGYSVANACMHCAQPLCLADCPTGAIAWHPGGTVVVSDDLCIGCGTCARACPYDNIRLVEAPPRPGGKEPRETAHKCDLCIGRDSGPACVNACPHDAIARVDLTKPSVVPMLADRSPLRDIRAAQARRG